MGRRLMFAGFMVVAVCALALAGCGSNGSSPSDSGQYDGSAGDGGSGDGGVKTGSRSQFGRFIILNLEGTPYEMGFQHGTLMHQELKEGMEWINQDQTFSGMLSISKLMGIDKIARSQSYPDIVQECQGLVAATKDVGWTLDACLLLNFGDVVQEYILSGMPETKSFAPNCSQFVVSGKATKDGGLLHGRLLDWDNIEFILKYPTIIVRKPNGGVPHVFIGFPSNISPYQGINANGIALASDMATPSSVAETALTGRSHVQMMAQILKSATSMDDVRKFFATEKHMATIIIVASDGVHKEGSVFELTAAVQAERRMGDDGLVYATNHFVSEEAQGHDKSIPDTSSSKLRFKRLGQLLTPGGTDWSGNPSTKYGAIDKEAMISVIRDRIDPFTGEQSGLDVFDNDKSIATNGNIFSVLMDPANRMIWVSGGPDIPVPQQTFTGFSLDELFGVPGAKKPDPAEFK